MFSSNPRFEAAELVWLRRRDLEKRGWVEAAEKLLGVERYLLDTLEA